MHKAFPLLGESSHWQYKFPLPVEVVPTARRMEILLPGVCTAMMKKLTVKENCYTKKMAYVLPMIVAVTEMYNSMYKDSMYYKRSLLVLAYFRIQQYLQLEHYALWEVIEFGDSYKAPTSTDPADSRTGRTVTPTLEDMQKKKNDVKARTTLLLSLPDEHQLRFSKYKTARELWAAILKTFGDSMSLDDLYNHLKVYEAEVQKKPNSNPQNMAFISSSKNSNNEDGNTVCVTTATTLFPTGSVYFATISQDTASAFIASQSNSSQIKFE
nr:hypothetical protein [Tanacetum cinerariifolium]